MGTPGRLHTKNRIFPRVHALARLMCSRLARVQEASAPSRWVGVDLGSASIKLVELEQTASGPRLLKSLIQELPVLPTAPPSSAPHPELSRPPDHPGIDLVGWLQSMMAECRVREVHVAIDGPDVVIRRVAVPLMPKSELPEALKWQVKEQLPFPIQDAVLDYRVIGDVWEKDVKKQDVLVAVGSAPWLHELVELIQRAGVRVASLSPAPVAAWRGVTAVMPETSTGSVALIEIGASKTTVTIAKDGHLRLVRELAVGSGSMTEALIGAVASESGEVAIDRSKAEQLKRQYGVLTESAQGLTHDGVPLFHLASLMRPVLEQLLTELSRVCDFYKVQLEESGVSRVLLCGAGANLKHLQSFLADGLGMTVDICNPLIRIPDRAQALDPEQLAEGGPRVVVALGAALAHGQDLDLMPPAFKTLRRHAQATHVLTVVATRMGAVALVLVLALQLLAWHADHRLKVTQRAWSQVEPIYHQYMTVTQATQQFAGAASALRTFVERQPLWEGVFKELGQLTPPTILLTDVTVTKPEAPAPGILAMHLRGTSALSGTGAEDSLAKFLEALEASVFFRHVRLVNSQVRAGTSGTTFFEAACELE